LEGATVSYIDLALDLWVAVDGTQSVLDEDEFLELALDEATRAQALSALEELKKKFSKAKPPA
jgi:predicted RNA-binding protein associated with RNAse of E/G family